MVGVREHGSRTRKHTILTRPCVVTCFIRRDEHAPTHRGDRGERGERGGRGERGDYQQSRQSQFVNRPAHQSGLHALLGEHREQRSTIALELRLPDARDLKQSFV